MYRSNNKRLFFVATLLVLIFFAYRPALTGALYYDDYSNLKNLASITSLHEAWRFVLDGPSGLFGRPVAMATFLLHIDDWPERSESILLVNVIIHLINATLFIALGNSILRAKYPTGNPNTHFNIAYAAAAIWATLPLLASTSLIAIQRMAGLSATFLLIGLCLFLLAHQSRYSPTKKFLLKTASLSIFGTLSFLTKENGGLIVIFALLIEYFIPSRDSEKSRYDRIFLAGLWASTAAILIYLSPLNKEWFEVFDRRGYTPWDRVQSQLVILWKYLYLAFLPQRPTIYGPFHDDVSLIQNPVLIATAAALWILFLAIACIYRKQTPLLLLALLWYLTAHLTESTSVMLELMFEHRNYVAVWGFCLLISYTAFNVRQELQRISKILLFSYWALLLGILFAMTNLWGAPKKAAESWAQAHPASARAALHSVFIELGVTPQSIAERNISYIDKSRVAVALKILDRTAAVCPACLDVQSQALAYSCQLEDDSIAKSRFDNLKSVAKSGTISISFVESMFDLRDLILRGKCPALSANDLQDLADSVISRTSQEYAPLMVRLHFVAAMAAEDANNKDLALEYLNKGEFIDPRALPILQYQVHILTRLGRNDEALDAIERRRPHIGSSDKSTMSHEQLNQLKDSVLKSRH